MDDCSRYLVSLVMAHHQRSTLVMEALTRGIADYGAPREVLTDQGRQYTAWRGQTEFEEELRRQGIRHIKSRPHHPETLGKIILESLAAHQVLLLQGPPYRTEFYGQIERQNRDHRAWLEASDDAGEKDFDSLVSAIG